jgi:fatty-acyl-CoA synthase
MAVQPDRVPVKGTSHVMGVEDEPLWELTIPQALARAVETWGDGEAAVFCAQGERRTYSQLASEVDDLALGLLRLGIAKGDRVGVWSPNRYEWLLAQFATARIGAILVCINPAYRVHELEYALNKVGCKALITAREFKTSDYATMLQDLCPELASTREGRLLAARVPSLESIICVGPETPEGMIPFDSVCAWGHGLSRAPLDEISATLDPREEINIQFTSGTTGNPKGATLTHHNIVNNARFVTSTIEATDQDRICIPVPFYHCFGMVLGTLGCVTKGATMVVPSEGFDPVDTLAAIASERCTSLYGVPTMFVAELAVPTFDDYDMSSLKTGIMGGAPCPIEVMKAVRTKMHMPGVTIIYGMTETSPISFQSNVDDPLEKRVSTVGRIHPHVEVKIVDGDGATAPLGEQGEIVTRGYSVMRGYWDDPEKTSEAIDEGRWMHTGDLGTIDDAGYCSITGRIKDMILRGGENVYPKEIEDFLYTHEAVEQVQVFGITDSKFGEIVCAWIVPREGMPLDEDQIRTYCADNLAYFKVPVHVRIMSDLPMTVTGKPQKFVMRERMETELATAE